jgi:hypothetical protein
MMGVFLVIVGILCLFVFWPLSIICFGFAGVIFAIRGNRHQSRRQELAARAGLNRLDAALLSPREIERLAQAADDRRAQARDVMAPLKRKPQ